jgi:hypothetical protein
MTRAGYMLGPVLVDLPRAALTRRREESGGRPLFLTLPD